MLCETEVTCANMMAFTLIGCSAQQLLPLHTRPTPEKKSPWSAAHGELTAKNFFLTYTYSIPSGGKRRERWRVIPVFVEIDRT